MIELKKLSLFLKRLTHFLKPLTYPFFKEKITSKAFFLAHLEKKVYLCEPLTLFRVSQLEITLKFI